MTPKEKAKELYLKYEFVYIANYTSKHEVKQCALIAVEEIIKNTCGSYMSGNYMAENNEIYCDECYWQDVKAEIEKL